MDALSRHEIVIGVNPGGYPELTIMDDEGDVCAQVGARNAVGLHAQIDHLADWTPEMLDAVGLAFIRLAMVARERGVTL